MANLGNPNPEMSEEFVEFLGDAHKHGYGTEDADHVLDKGIHQITYDPSDDEKNCMWRYVDRWVGGEPFAGAEVISHFRFGDEPWMPVWSMTYFGECEDPELADKLGPLLGKILAVRDPELPIRGPKEMSIDGYEYSFEPTKGSKLSKFEASEIIYKGENRLYIAKFMGGIINRLAVEPGEEQPWLE